MFLHDNAALRLSEWLPMRAYRSTSVADEADRHQRPQDHEFSRRKVLDVRALLRIARPPLLLAVLVGVIGGLPWGLSIFYWSPVPDRVPAYADVTGWLDAAKLFPRSGVD